jgi:hypothetical protein
LLACAVLFSFLSSGCVQRRLLIRSDPPGAVLYVDNLRMGTTPCAINYVYYGTREMRLVKDGFETLKVEQPLPAPWYQVPPLDFVADVLVPYEIRDVRSVTYRLQPQYIVPKEHLLARAEELRRSTQGGAIYPAGPQPQPLAPGAETLPPNGQPIELDTHLPGDLSADSPSADGWLPAETLPPGGIEVR